MKFSLDKLISGIKVEGDKESKEKIINKCRVVVGKILEWAHREGIDVTNVEKLGGGFVNLVLLIQTKSGRSYVAKSFSDDDDVTTSKKAQKIINSISDEDMEFIPEVISWVDDDLMISEKAEGFPVKNVLVDLKEGTGSLESAKEAFYHLGEVIGSLHERTESHSGESDTTGAFDAKAIIKDLGPDSVIREHLQNIDSELIDNAANSILNLTDYKQVSVVHGDTHLDQFFFAPDKSMMTIVDYDSLRIGDPMFDVSRTIASLRSWCHKIGIDYELESELTQSLIEGYRHSRDENGAHDDDEFSYMRVVAYEVKLYLVQIKYMMAADIDPESNEFKFSLNSLQDCIKYLASIQKEA